MLRYRFAVLGTVVLAAAWPGAAVATNGYFSLGYDEQSKGQAGVGVSSADGVAAAAANPALGVKAGNSLGGGFSLFSPHRDDTNSGGSVPGYDAGNGRFDSSRELFLIPYLGANYQLDDRTALSVLLYANGGMNTSYKNSPFAALGFPGPRTTAGVDLAQVFITPNLARKLGSGITVGGGPVLAVQRFKATGLQAFDNAFFSSAPGSVTDNGYSYSYGGGFKLGATWDAADWLTFGSAYQSRTWTTDFKKYRGLFAEHGNFDIPPQVTAGLTVRPLKTLDVSFEYQHIFYGDIKSIANAGNDSGQLGASDGKGFGWQDLDVFRVGIQWRAFDQLVLRTGYSHASDFTTGSNALFNILAPATVKDHLTVGAGYDITPNWTISAAYVHAFSNTLTGWNVNDPSQTIKLRMDQDEGTLGVRYRW